MLAKLAPLREGGRCSSAFRWRIRTTERAQKKCAAKGCDAMLAVELTGELPYGERRMHCALVTGDTILVQPAMRSKPEAATMLADWLVPRMGEARIEQAELRATQSV